MRLLTTAFLIILTVTGLSSIASAAPKIGQQAPQFTGTDMHGEQIRLKDYLGTTVVLEWTNHECPYVRKHYDTGNMQSLQKDATEDGIIWLSIASSALGHQGHTGAEEALTIMKETGSYATTRILDPEGSIGTLYDARTTPHMFVINPKGILVYMGAIDDSPSSQTETVEAANNFVRKALYAIKNNTQPIITSTHPYGCSVKYK